MRSIRVLPKAETDAQAIFDWLSPQSREGALRWWAAFDTAQERIRGPGQPPLRIDEINI